MQTVKFEATSQDMPRRWGLPLKETIRDRQIRVSAFRSLLCNMY